MIDLRVDRTNRFLGTSNSKEAMVGYLKALEMEVESVDENTLRVTRPFFRVDLTREVDLVEEIARLQGYNEIPVTYPRVRPTGEKAAPQLGLRDRLRSILVGFGFSEIITYSFIGPDSADKLGVEPESPLRCFVPLLNPLTGDQSVMRTSLVHGLLETVYTNYLYDERDVRLFEWGKVFFKKEGDQQPLEVPILGVAMTGQRQQKMWYDEAYPMDFYDLKGVAEGLLRAIGVPDLDFRGGAGCSWYDAQYSAQIFADGYPMGYMGRISSPVMHAYGLKNEEVFVLELDGGSLLTMFGREKRFEPLLKFPAVYRDISILVPIGVESEKIMRIIRQQGGELVESIRVFDLYTGKGIDPSEKALGFRVCYRSKKGTLDGDEVNHRHGSIITKIVNETGGRLREG